MFDHFDAGFEFYDAGILGGIPDSLECETMGEISMMHARDISDAALIDTLDSLDDSSAIDLLDSLPPRDASRIARKMGA